MVADLKMLRYYVRTYEDLQAREVDLDQAGLDGAAIRTIPVTQTEAVQNGDYGAGYTAGGEPTRNAPINRSPGPMDCGAH